VLFLGVYIMPAFCVSVYVCILSLLGNGSEKTLTAATDTHATIEEFFKTSFSMPSASYQM
jgi:hypothetical protein